MAYTGGEKAKIESKDLLIVKRVAPESGEKFNNVDREDSQVPF